MSVAWMHAVNNINTVMLNSAWHFQFKSIILNYYFQNVTEVTLCVEQEKKILDKIQLISNLS